MRGGYFMACLGCKGKGFVLKMPEKVWKPCRLCNGTGKDRV